MKLYPLRAQGSAGQPKGEGAAVVVATESLPKIREGEKKIFYVSRINPEPERSSHR